MKTKIYTLTECNGMIRYIGKTIRPLQGRLSNHLNEARRNTAGYKNNWIRSLLKHGFIPSIILISEVEGDGCKEEIAWIKYFRSEGVKLVNTTDGGEGTPGHVVSKEVRKKMSAAVSPERRELLRANFAHSKSSEEIRKIRKGSKKWWATHSRSHSLETKAKMKASRNKFLQSPAGLLLIREKYIGHSPTNKGKKTPPDLIKKAVETRTRLRNERAAKLIGAV